MLLTDAPICKSTLRTRGAAALICVVDTTVINLNTVGAHFGKGMRDVPSLFTRQAEWSYLPLRDKASYKHAYLLGSKGQVVEIVKPNFTKPETTQYKLGGLYTIQLSDGSVGGIHSGDVVRLELQEPSDYYGETAFFVKKINHTSERWVPSSATFTPFK